MRTDIVRNEVAICEPASRLATIQTLAVRSKICLHGRLHIRIHAHIGCGITKHYQRRNRRRRGYNTAAAKWQHHQQQNEAMAIIFSLLLQKLILRLLLFSLPSPSRALPMEWGQLWIVLCGHLSCAEKELISHHVCHWHYRMVHPMSGILPYICAPMVPFD